MLRINEVRTIIEQFIHDMIHMTEGEKFINYWWLWPSIIGIIFLGLFLIQNIKWRK